MIKGAMGINGISSRSGLVTYKVSENCVDIKADSIFKLDLCCNSEISFHASVYANVGEKDETEYALSVDVPKGEVWQNIVLSAKDFKTKEGRPIQEFDRIDKIKFSANGFFAINNVLVI